MKRRLPNPTLAECSLSLPAVGSMVFGFLVTQIPLLFMMSFHDVSPEEVIARVHFWKRVALIALLFSVLLFLFGLLEITRKKAHRRKTTAIVDFFASAVQLHLWHGASRLADLNADFA